MPQDIYNEGRVVGYSAYETYVKQALSVDPTKPVANEREWLSASLAAGTSMLVRIPPINILGSGEYAEPCDYIDIPFPDTSRLVAANNIIGSYFDGSVTLDDSGYWATSVNTAGNAINVSSISGEIDKANISTIPEGDSVNYNNLYTFDELSLKNYNKIIDMVIIQSGTWDNRDLTPNLSESPVLRVKFADSIEVPVLVLLTGFTDSAIIQGTSELGGSRATDSPQNGDFLGPATFPWVSKVTLTLSTYYAEVLRNKFNIIWKNPLSGYSPTVFDFDESNTTIALDPQEQSDLYNYFFPSNNNKYNVNTSGELLEGQTEHSWEGPYLKYQDENIITIHTDSDMGPIVYYSRVNSLIRHDTYLSDNIVDLYTLGANPIIYSIKNYTLTDTYTFTVDSGKIYDNSHTAVGVYNSSDGTLSFDSGILHNDANSSFVISYHPNTDHFGYNSMVNLFPVTTAAPHDVKAFTDLSTSDLNALASLYPGVYIYNFKSDGSAADIVYKVDDSSSITTLSLPLVQVTFSPLGYTNIGVSSSTAKLRTATLNIGSSTVRAITAQKANNGSEITISQNPSSTIEANTSNTSNNITWSALFTALATDKGLDILGTRLKDAKSSLVQANKKGYLEFGSTSDPLRLYISATQPTDSDIPIGSIGIGWGMTT